MTAAVGKCDAQLGSDLSACQLRRDFVISGLNIATLHGAVLVIATCNYKCSMAARPMAICTRMLEIDAQQGLRHIGGAREAIIKGSLPRIGAVVDVIEFPQLRD